MGIASLILGIVSLILGIIPFCGMIAIIPAIVGLILGIVDLVKKSKLEKAAKETDGENAPKQKKGLAIAGIILNPVAIIVTIVWVLVLSVAIVDSASQYSNTIYDYSNEITDYANLFSNSANSEASGKLATIKTGETYTGKNIKITYVASDANFTNYGKYSTVTDGKKVVKVDLVIENLGSESEYISTYDFNCYADGFDCDTFYNSDDSTSLSSTLTSGKKTSGSIYFEVPTDSKTITLEYELNSYPEQQVEFIIQ